MKISLIVTTYNWKEALALCLDGIFAQTRLPDEIVVADDGSREDTAELIIAYKQKSPVPLLHVWQPDEGFQAAKIRNRGIAAACGDYLILLDGDMVVNRFFIEDHRRLAETGAFVQGKRALLDACATRRILESKKIGIGPLFPGVKFSNRKFLLRSPALSRLFSPTDRRLRGTMSCNMAVWRDDIFRVNGFDERFVLHGGEDIDFAQRLLHLGLKRRYVKHLAVGAHLYHSCRGNPDELANERFVEKCRELGTIRCSQGIDQYLQIREEGGLPSLPHGSRAAASQVERIAAP
jgi:GT2 family glycosyltransferase